MFSNVFLFRTVAKFLRKSERKEPQFTNVYVKNLDKDFTESSLKEIFSKYGKITSAIIMKDAEGKSRGFGFVNFESHENAVKAIEGLNGAEIGITTYIPSFLYINSLLFLLYEVFLAINLYLNL